MQTAAFNLPNDERIAKEMGTKRTMLKNVQEAKFAKVLVPISKVVLAPADRAQVTFQAFFTHILMHELMHGLGPHEVQARSNAAGKPGTVRAALQEAYSPLEEAKADISGLFALQHLIDKGVIDRAMERPMYTTFLASAFRSLRFGLSESHGKGVALQLNTLLDAGAFRVAKAGTFSVDLAKVKEAVKALTGEIMAVQAAGDRGTGAGAAADAGGHPARGPAGPRPPTDCPGGHRAPVHNGGGAAGGPARKKLNRTPCQRRWPCHPIEPAVLKALTWFRKLSPKPALRPAGSGRR